MSVRFLCNNVRISYFVYEQIWFYVAYTGFPMSAQTLRMFNARDNEHANVKAAQTSFDSSRRFRK